MSIKSVQKIGIRIGRTLIQGFLVEAQKSDFKKIEAILNQIVNANKPPIFDTVRCYEVFLTLIDQAKPTFFNRNLYPQALSIFRKYFPLPGITREVNLIGKNGASCVVGREVLELRFDYFTVQINSSFKEKKTTEEKYILTCKLPNGEALSKETLECFKLYVCQNKIVASSLDVLHELLAWASFLDDDTFKEDCVNSIIDYLTSKEHVDEFDSRYVKECRKQFVKMYLAKREIKFNVDQKESLVITLNGFCHLAQEAKSLALEFVISSIYTIVIDDGYHHQNIDRMALIERELRESILHIECESKSLTLAHARQLMTLFPNGAFSTHMITELTNRYPPDDKNSFRVFLAGRYACENLQFEEAETHYKKALELDPKDSLIQGYLGQLYLQCGRRDNAVGYLKEAVALNPENSFAEACLGDLYCYNDSEKAMEHFENAAELSPQDLSIREHLMEIYFADENFEKIQEQAEKVVELDPSNFSAQQYLAVIYYYQNELEKSREHFENAAALKFHRDERLADIYRRLGKLEILYAYLKKAIEVNPHSIYAWLGLGCFFYDDQNNLEKAEKNFEKATELNPGDFNFWYEIGTFYHQRGNLQKAQEHYERAVTLPHTFFSLLAAAHCNLGEIYHKQGNLEKAQEYLEKAVELRPEDSSARERLALVLKERESSQALPKGGDPMDISDERSTSDLKRKTNPNSKSEGPPIKKARTDDR